MALFGPDPKDEIIEVLRNERDYLRAKVGELEKQLLALHSTHAFRLVHPAEASPDPPRPAPTDPFTLRATDYRPLRTIAELQKEASTFRSKDD